MIKINPKGKKAWVNFSFMPEHKSDLIEISADFNGWKEEAMKSKKDGSFYIRKYLLVGESYEFRYLIDGQTWANEPNVALVDNSFGSKNSFLQL